MTLTEFLLACFAEDEAVARAVVADNFDEGPIGTGDDPWPSERTFAEHLTPARVLAECEAKRRIVERWNAMAARADERGRPAHLFDPVLSMLLKSHEYELRLLALPYADRPGYDERWRP